jgi:hypothetical protein
MADSWGQFPSGSDRPVSSPQTSANTDVRHVNLRNVQQRRGTILGINNEREQEQTAAGDAWSCDPICTGSDCRRRVVM